MPSSCDPEQILENSPPVAKWKPYDFRQSDAGWDNNGSKGNGFEGKSFSGLSSQDLPAAVETQKTNSPEDANPISETPPNGKCALWDPTELSHSWGVIGKSSSYKGRQDNKMGSPEARARAESEASQILQAASQQSARMLQEASSKADEIFRQAYADGLNSSRAETETLLRSAQQLVNEVQVWKEAIFEQGEMTMLRLVIEIAQTIFGDGLPLDPDTLGQTFSRALLQAKSLGNLRVYVHPEDAIPLNNLWSKIQSTFNGQQIELIPSDIVKRGGCFIDGQFGTVDARIETQFAVIKEALLTNQPSPAVVES